MLHRLAHENSYFNGIKNCGGASRSFFFFFSQRYFKLQSLVFTVWFYLPWGGIPCLDPLRLNRFNSQGVSWEAGSLETGTLPTALCHGWLLEPRSLFPVSIHGTDVSQEVFPRKCSFYLFPNGECVNHSVLAKGQHPFASGTVGMNCKSLHNFSMKHLFATIRFYHYQILIQGQN